MVNRKGISRQREIRLSKIEDLMLRGFTSPYALAVRFDLSVAQIELDQAIIRKRWKRKENRNRGDRKRYRIRQLEKVIQQAHDSFERSKKPVVETSFIKKPRKCSYCKDGFLEDGSWCPVCEGEGVIVEEVESQKVKGREGDTNHLRVVTDALKEINKVEGHHAEKKMEVKGNVGVTGIIGMVHKNLDGGGEYTEASQEILLKAMAALSDLRESVNDDYNNVKQISSKVVDKGD